MEGFLKLFVLLAFGFVVFRYFKSLLLLMLFVFLLLLFYRFAIVDTVFVDNFMGLIYTQVE